MVVFTFGDCNGDIYESHGWRSSIDHLNMNKYDNRVENLQIVSNIINLHRAYRKTKKTYIDHLGYPQVKVTPQSKRFFESFNRLNPDEKRKTFMEIEDDLNGNY